MRRHSWKAAVVLAALATLPSGPAGAEPSDPDSSMVIPGGSEGATLKDMTVEGEDKIRIEFERPALDLDLNPREAPGLDWDHRPDVINRTDVSFDRPFLRATAGRMSPYLGCPWFDRFTTDPVARFHPKMDGVARWKLSVANSRGEAVAEFTGEGKPPKEITWSGLTTSGSPALPGLVYSYVFEAYDEAGNKRNIMGDAFELPPYRLEANGGLWLLFPAGDLVSSHPSPSSKALLMEAASWINQSRDPERPVKIEAMARTYEQARTLADGVIQGLEGRVLGDPQRLRPLTTAEPNAPADGAVVIRLEGSDVH
jgi:hypothetical protein